ncbi:MAG TPA: carboxypeptidase-like regulatory domain-containing protein [Vicinamibacterales bacterium]|nr:carboxypeptidase-like regulatory domain-containing protein [Vicinamibacterales bacterium]
MVDQTNAVLPRATVTLFTLDGNPGVTATADDSGVVVFPALATGLAEIVVRFPGFSPYIDKATIEPGDNARAAVLRLAPVNEVVTVKATPSGNRS